MGLEIVQIVLSVEETFEVRIPEDDWSRIRTVGGLHRSICQQLDEQRTLLQNDAAPAIEPFIAVRNGLLTLTTCNKSEIRPSTPLRQLISRRGRNQVWKRLQTMTHISLPPLVLPRRIRFAIGTLFGITVVFMTAYFYRAIGPAAIPLGFCASAIALTLIHLATRPFAVTFPKSCSTVRDLVYHAKPPTYLPQRSTPIPNDPTEVWSKLTTVVSDILDMPRSQISVDSRFVEDLKCG